VKNNVKPPKHDAVPVPDNRSPLTNSANVELGPDGVNVNVRLTEIGELADNVTAAVVFPTAAFATVPISNRNVPVPPMVHWPVQTTHATPGVVTVVLIDPMLPVLPVAGMIVDPMNT
jgi:hypothetical protein